MKKSNDTTQYMNPRVEVGGEWQNTAGVTNISHVGNCSLAVAIPSKPGFSPQVFSAIGDEIFVFESNEECVRAFLKEALATYCQRYVPTVTSGLILRDILCRMDEALERVGVSSCCVKVFRMLMEVAQ